MKAVMLWGDMGSDRPSEQYPEAAICDKCFKKLMEDPEGAGIVSEVTYDSSVHGTECSRCCGNDS